jgi:hypothetical protein
MKSDDLGLVLLLAGCAVCLIAIGLLAGWKTALFILGLQVAYIGYKLI